MRAPHLLPAGRSENTPLLTYQHRASAYRPHALLPYSRRYDRSSEDPELAVEALKTVLPILAALLVTAVLYTTFESQLPGWAFWLIYLGSTIVFTGTSIYLTDLRSMKSIASSSGVQKKATSAGVNLELEDALRESGLSNSDANALAKTISKAETDNEDAFRRFPESSPADKANRSSDEPRVAQLEDSKNLAQLRRENYVAARKLESAKKSNVPIVGLAATGGLIITFFGDALGLAWSPVSLYIGGSTAGGIAAILVLAAKSAR